jgi:hypothetical protein
MKLWNVTLSYPLGRKMAHSSYAVLAETPAEAQAKAIAYVYPNPTQPVDYTVEGVQDEDGVMKCGTRYTRLIPR